jgi:hypothetical protein
MKGCNITSEMQRKSPESIIIHVLNYHHGSTNQGVVARTRFPQIGEGPLFYCLDYYVIHEQPVTWKSAARDLCLPITMIIETVQLAFYSVPDVNRATRFNKLKR